MELIFWFVNRELLDTLLRLTAQHPYFGAAMCLWVFYIGFVMYAGLQPAIEARRWWILIPCIPILIPAFLIDLMLSPLFGILVFHELTFKWTISGRLRSHYYESGWRGERARHFGDRVDWVMPFHINSVRL